MGEGVEREKNHSHVCVPETVLKTLLIDIMIIIIIFVSSSVGDGDFFRLVLV